MHEFMSPESAMPTFTGTPGRSTTLLRLSAFHRTGFIPFHFHFPVRSNSSTLPSPCRSRNCILMYVLLYSHCTALQVRRTKHTSSWCTGRAAMSDASNNPCCSRREMPKMIHNHYRRNKSWLENGKDRRGGRVSQSCSLMTYRRGNDSSRAKPCYTEYGESNSWKQWILSWSKHNQQQ
jgi:hypothetical protein